MFLTDIKIVDMKHSKWDKQKSNPDKGEYVFTNKKYVDYNDTGRKLDYFWQWGDVEPGELNRWKYAWNYSEVRAEDNLFWPEGIAPDADGRYVFRDAILLKIKVKDYAAKRKPEIEQSERATRAMFEGFGAKVRRDAKRAGMPREDIDRMVDSIVLDERRNVPQPDKPLLQPKKIYPK